jgi:hypothetical protein
MVEPCLAWARAWLHPQHNSNKERIAGLFLWPNENPLLWWPWLCFCWVFLNHLLGCLNWNGYIIFMWVSLTGQGNPVILLTFIVANKFLTDGILMDGFSQKAASPDYKLLLWVPHFTSKSFISMSVNGNDFNRAQLGGYQQFKSCRCPLSHGHCLVPSSKLSASATSPPHISLTHPFSLPCPPSHCQLQALKVPLPHHVLSIMVQATQAQF